ncbi:TetR/AcrR family transcriptional regulator [Massilia norwichensis]|jgi:AcrR family transcriptional regulator|uniref:TetR family transcriptional regulator n=1 Tax=Massilia norwichensis TaxID=1442366 RepID=A0ABT2A152_9BURK|nr:TetR/AcrR family transcriptional regulator [Massilia norwichensis]MCS0587915.1 TetR family transcriptional regulator [Massilia norwichensis]
MPDLPETTNSPAASPASAKAPPNKRDTLRRIAAAARREFAARGLADARVDDIAQAAGVTKQLVYHYFRSKEELFACVLDESSALAMDALLALELDHLPPREALRALLDRMLLPYHDEELRALAQEGIRYHETHTTPRNSFTGMAPQLNEKMRTTLTRGIASGAFRADVDADLLLAMSALATTSAYVNRYTVATLAGLDVAGGTGADTWRRFAVAFVLSAVERERSALDPLTRDAS